MSGWRNLDRFCPQALCLSVPRHGIVNRQEGVVSEVLPAAPSCRWRGTKAPVANSRAFQTSAINSIKLLFEILHQVEYGYESH